MRHQQAAAFAVIACLASGCASESQPRRPAATSPAIAHTCTVLQQPMVDRFGERLREDFRHAVDDARIPLEARAQQIRGLVVVVVGYSNGERDRVGIAHSSGYAVLDNHAVKLVSAAAPEHTADLPCDAATLRVALRYGNDNGDWPVSNAIRSTATFATPMR